MRYIQGQRLPVTQIAPSAGSRAMPLSTSVPWRYSARRQQPAQVDAGGDLAAERIDDHDAIALPDVGPDGAVYPFQFVEQRHRPALFGHGDGAQDVRACRVT